MDMEQEEMQFLGFFGIFKEAYKLIISRRKIFSQITLSLILPLSLLTLVHTELSVVLSHKIMNNEIDLENTQAGTKKYEKLVDMISSELAFFFLFKAAYVTFLLVFSFLSTSAVVYTIACVYTARSDLSFAKVMSVVPKVYKRLIVTFLWTFLAIFLYNFTSIIIFVIVSIILSFLSNDPYVVLLAIATVFFLIYVLGLIYLTLVWSLASVVSVLEDVRGIEAMKKSKALMKGKMWTSLMIFGVLGVFSYVLQLVFQSHVVEGSIGKWESVGYGLLCLLVSVMFMLLGLVVQTILYFVCKSYHHENIDKSALSDHLEVYLGDYVPLNAKDVQLEQYHV